MGLGVRLLVLLGLVSCSSAAPSIPARVLEDAPRGGGDAGVVDVGEAAEVVVREGGGALAWWTPDVDGVAGAIEIEDLESGARHSLAARGGGVRFVASGPDAVAVEHDEGTLDVVRVRDGVTLLSVPADGADVVFDPAGARVAWATHPKDDTGESVARFQVAELGRGRVTSFEGAFRCPIAREWLVSLEGDALTTEGECTPGCGSIPPAVERFVYEPSTGRVR